MAQNLGPILSEALERERLQKALSSLKKELDLRNKERHLMTEKIEKMTLEAVSLRRTKAQQAKAAQLSPSAEPDSPGISPLRIPKLR